MTKNSLQPTENCVPLRHEFAADEWEQIKCCNEEHGFSVVKEMLEPAYVERLKSEVNRVLDGQRASGTHDSASFNFIEMAPVFWEIFRDERYAGLYRYLLDSDEISIHRSAAIRRMPGAPGMHWHSDHVSYDGPARNSADILNRHNWPNGAWFYLSGLHPDRGGLAVIPGSHRETWKGPEGFTLTESRDSFYPLGTRPEPYSGMDVPGMVSLYTDPGDMVLFAARTFHAVFEHHGDQPRLACAVVCRPAHPPLEVPWDLPPSARQLRDSAPDYLQPFVHGYTGIDIDWRGKTQ